MTETEAYSFSLDFQRKLLRVALDQDLRVRAPGTLKSSYFGMLSTTVRSPLHILALLLEEWEVHSPPGQAMGTVTMDELVRSLDQSARFSEEERTQTRLEWAALQSLTVSDPDFVLHHAGTWAQTQALLKAVNVVAGHLLQADATGTAPPVDHILAQFRSAAQVGQSRAQWDDYVATAPERIHRWHHRTAHKVPTGLSPLDAALRGGPSRQESWYLLAPTKAGKTTFLLNFALHAARQRKGVAFFSYEMRKEALQFRMDQQVAQLTRSELQQDATPLRTAMSGWKAAGTDSLFVFGYGQQLHGVAEVYAGVEQLRNHGRDVSVVVLDFLNKMVSSAGKKHQEVRHELASIAREMSQLAKDLDVVVWSAMFANRQAEKKVVIDKDDVAESYEVVGVADGVVSICGGPVLRQKHGCCKLYVAAAREEEDGRWAGCYALDLPRMTVKAVADPMKEEEKSDA